MQYDYIIYLNFFSKNILTEEFFIMKDDILITFVPDIENIQKI